MSTAVQRRLPVGAEVMPSGAHFRVWAPKNTRVDVVLVRSGSQRMEKEDDGYFSTFVENAAPGMRYQFRLNDSDLLLPDPASRFQPDGPHGPSQIVDASAYRWNDSGWRGVEIRNQVLYEIHIGTFTPEGTWNAAQKLLPELAETGITVLEVMPVAEFPGGFGWGYDGVDLFAPSHLYGTPEDLRAFIDRAHSLGLGVILDVVYNHFGPDGNYLKHFSDSYFTHRYENEWGEAINFDGPDSEPVRELIASNACYWIEEFHIDGLRLDATQQIFDNSGEHILSYIGREVRKTAGRRSVILIGENEPQDPRLARSADEGGYGLDALWNDDFHHAARVAMTGRNEAYYSDYCGSPQELISALKWGFLYQGQFYAWQRKRRGGASLDLPPTSFVNYIENHDQIANSAYGSRTRQLTSPGRYRAITGLLLLGPATPMLFQGQEYGATTPFLYFADHNEALRGLVEQGRREFMSQFPSLCSSGTEFAAGAPHEWATFKKCKLDPADRGANPQIIALHRDLLKLRRDDPVFRQQRSDWIHGAVLGPESFVLRILGGDLGDRLIVVNLGRDLRLRPAPEPLLADPRSGRWEMLWSSEDSRYGGCGRSPVRRSGAWNIPGHSAVVMYERTGD